MSKEIEITKTQIKYFETILDQGERLTKKEEEHILRLFRILAWYEQREKEEEEHSTTLTT